MTDHVAVILYEDQLVDGARNYGPHSLVLACIEDRLKPDHQTDYRYELKKQIFGIPKKGASKLLAACTDKKILVRCPRGQPLFIVLDADRPPINNIPPKDRCPPGIVREMRKRQSVPESVRICFIERNTESIVKAAAEALQRPVPRKKKPLDRDAVLEAAASAHPDVRQRIQEDVPSLRRLVKRLADEYVVASVMLS